MKNILVSFLVNIGSSIAVFIIVAVFATYQLESLFLAIGIAILVIFLAFTITYIFARQKSGANKIQSGIPQVDNAKRLEAKTFLTGPIIQADRIEQIQIGEVNKQPPGELDKDKVEPQTKREQEVEITNPHNQSGHTLPYRILLGRRHRHLRENFLKLNKREMRDFYGFEMVSLLEEYEGGEEEFPRECIQRLVEFFFVNKQYLDGESESVFRRFNQHDSSYVDHLLEEGFRPYFLCCPEQREQLYAYPVLHKDENNYSRVIVAKRLGSFASPLGHSSNIEQIIQAMVRKGIDWVEAEIYKVDTETWHQLAISTFYSRTMTFGHASWDSRCDEIFQKWYEVIYSQHRN